LLPKDSFLSGRPDLSQKFLTGLLQSRDLLYDRVPYFFNVYLVIFVSDIISCLFESSPSDLRIFFSRPFRQGFDILTDLVYVERAQITVVFVFNEVLFIPESVYYVLYIFTVTYDVL